LHVAKKNNKIAENYCHLCSVIFWVIIELENWGKCRYSAENYAKLKNFLSFLWSIFSEIDGLKAKLEQIDFKITA
jgi:hypothetical protein